MPGFLLQLTGISQHWLNSQRFTTGYLYFYYVRTIILSSMILFVSCGTGSSGGNRNDSVTDAKLEGSDDVGTYYDDSIKAANYYDSVIAAIEAVEWIKFDSLPGDSVELWRKESAGNGLSVQVRYTLRGEKHRVMVTDNLASYRHDIVPNHLQLVQLNSTGTEEVVITIGGYYSSLSGGQYTSWAEDEYHHFVIDRDSGKLLWQGVHSSEYVQWCGAKSDSACEEIETGYSYKVHFSSSGIVIDSVQLLGETKEADLDHAPGYYYWKNGQFVKK